MKVLFTPYGGGSIAHVIRSLAVADELRKRGHQILFTSPKSKKAFIENVGGYEVFGEGHAEVNFNDENNQDASYFEENHDKFINWFQDELNAAEWFQPDIVVNSPSFPGSLIWHKYGIPYASIINANWIDEYRGLLGMSKSNETREHRAMRRVGKPIFRRGFEKVYVPRMSRFYKELGIEYTPGSRADLHRHVPALIPSVPDFEPVEQNSRDDIHYIGPLFWDGFEREEFKPQDHFSEWGEKPFVYVSLGGSIHRKQSYTELVEAFSLRDDWNIALSLGPNFNRSDFPPDSDHFMIRPYLPGLKVCEYADVVVNTAGHGTVMQALWHGKPLVTLPHNIDQGTFAERIVELNLGINLNQPTLKDFTDRARFFKRALDTPWESIISGVDLVLRTPSIHISALQFSKQLRAYGNASANAADLIERYAKFGKQ